MTLADIKQKVRMVGLHHFGGKHDLDPFGLEYLIIETANEIARRSDCMFGRRYLDLVADQSEYCSPDIYRIRGVFKLKDGDYERIRILEFSSVSVDAYRTSSHYELDTCILMGMNRIGFKPAPTDALANGIMIEGFMQPGNVWQYDVNGNAVALDDAHECPLPDVAHDCVVYGVLYKRAMQMKDADSLALFRNEYLQHLGEVESFAAIYGRRTV